MSGSDQGLIIKEMSMQISQLEAMNKAQEQKISEMLKEVSDYKSQRVEPDLVSVLKMTK